MKVLVINNAAPFIRGGAEALADTLVSKLNTVSNVEAELLRIPFKWDPPHQLIDEMLLCRQLKLINVDRVIALKFPAYLVEHPQKTLWLLHQFRQAYDLRDPALPPFGDADQGQSILTAIQAADHHAFRSARAIYTNSPVTRDRLQKYNGFQAEVLYPPLNDAEQFQGGDLGSYVFAGGRVGPGKRQHLLIEALRHTKSIRLVIAGPPDSEAYANELIQLVERFDLSARVELRLGFRDREEISKLVNGSLACAYLPIDEDSLGYVTMEAAEAAKAVLTLNDSGGLLELVENDLTGVVCHPEVEAIAHGLSRLTERGRAQRFGQALKQRWQSMNITWDHTLERLLA